VPGEELSSQVVPQPRRLDCHRLVCAIRRAQGGRREHLHADAGLVHHLEPPRDVIGVVRVGVDLGAAAETTAGERRYGVVVRSRVVVGVDVDDHER
jgi:hypothetical protein